MKVKIYCLYKSYLSHKNLLYFLLQMHKKPLFSKNQLVAFTV